MTVRHRPRLAVFASGTGSNFVRIARAAQAQEISAELVLLFCDQKDAPVLRRAEEAGIDTLCFSPADCASREAYELRIRSALDDRGADLVALAGYMRIVGQPLLEGYEGRIVNLHPSLLPAFPGRHAIADAFAAGVPETGVTVHFVDRGIDTGPIIAQERVPILPGDTLADLEDRIHRAEHRLYPDVIQSILGGLSES